MLHLYSDRCVTKMASEEEDWLPVLPGVLHTHCLAFIPASNNGSFSRARHPCSEPSGLQMAQVVQHESRVNTIPHSKATTGLFNGTGWRGKVAECKCDGVPDRLGRHKACFYEILNQLGRKLRLYSPHTNPSRKLNVIASHDFAHVSTKKFTSATK